MGRNRKKSFYEKVTITDVGAEGKSLAKIGEKVVFTTLAAPGDVVDLQVIKVRKNYEEAKIVKFHHYAEQRVTPFCKHFGICGGCKWQFIPYEQQLTFKHKQVEDQLRRIGKLEIPPVNPVLGSEQTTFYRNKLEFTFSNSRWLTEEEILSQKEIPQKNALGFHVPGLFDKVIPIDKCWLQPDPSNQIRNFLYHYACEEQLSFFDIRNQEGFLRTLIIRTTSTGEVMVIVTFYYEDQLRREALLAALQKAFPEITSLMYVVNPKGNDTITDQEVKLFAGNDHIWEEMEGLRFKIGSKSFYQTNSQQAHRLYQVAREFAGLSGHETVYDLYTGTGTIANFVARHCRKVIGIEYVPEAIEDARINAAVNNIGNTLFFAGDIKELLTPAFFERHGAPEVVITDPPRAGMHEEVIKAILHTSPERIVYVSCNPATQARDLALLSVSYQVRKVQSVDMFPHTHHVENVVLLEKI